MLFSQQRSKQPQALALSDTRQERSWLNLYQQVLKLSRIFQQEYALAPGQHIALLMGNRVEFFEAMLAGIASGLWVTPINTHLSDEEKHYIVQDCDASLLVHDEAHANFSRQVKTCKTLNLETLSTKLLDADTINGELDGNRPSGGTMLYTSGTTGRPKGVRRSKPQRLDETLASMQNGAKAFGLQGLGPHLVTGPLYHAAPMLFALYDMLNGAPVIIMPKWDNQHFVELVHDYQVHTSHLVPTMFVRLLHAHEQHSIPAKKPDSLKLVLHGAAPVAPAIKHRMIEWWGPILTEYWGASEAGTSTLVSSEEWLAHPGTVGRALPHLEIFIGDEQGNRLDSESGLLFCRHNTLEQVFEYHKDPEKTAKAHPKPHTFCIGDIGHIDQDGYVYLSGRQSNMIISGGVNIYPAEIEQALITHPAIADIHVFGIPDDEWGESVKALIELKQEIQKQAGLDENSLREDIQHFARQHIGAYKMPRHIEFVTKVPRNAAGKVSKEAIQPYLH